MKTYIIAEVGPNHNGSVKLAQEMIEKLARAGTNAVKFQICIPEEVYSLDAFKARYQKENEKSATPLEMSKSYQLSFEDHKILYQVCRENNVDYLCSAFDMKSLVFIDENFDMPFFKIPSGEIFTLDMMEYIAKRNRSVILSTGMATYPEIGVVIDLLNKGHKKRIILLHCVSNYPTPHKDVNLNVMAQLKDRFGYEVGFSDHTIGNECAIAAVSLGAVVVEKHVTLDRNMPGPDHKASATVDEFAELVKAIRNIEKALGGNKKIFSESELEIKNVARKSMVSKRDLLPGETIAKSDICYKRPGIGLSPLEETSLIGKKVKRKIPKNRVIRKEDIIW